MIGFSSLVPRCVVERAAAAADGGDLPGQDDQPWSDTEYGTATMLVDISGYSLLTTALATAGKVSGEVISNSVSGYFSKVLEVVEKAGGDVIKFLGDGLIIKWRGSRSEAEATTLAMRPAVQCALFLLLELGSFLVDTTMLRSTPMDEITLRLHIGIGFGVVTSSEIGIPGTRVEFVISGPAVDELKDATDATMPGELGLSPNAWAALPDLPGFGDDFSNCGISVKKGCLVMRCREGVAPAFLRWAQEAKPPRAPVAKGDHQLRLARVLRTHVNESAAYQIEASGGKLQLNEHRFITSAFIQLKGPFSVAVAHKVMQKVVPLLKDHKGVLQQFSVDDKGQTILAFFGLPPWKSANDAAAALAFCWDLRRTIADENLPPAAIGVASGHVFYTIIGYDQSAETQSRTFVTCLGDAVNVSARLMCLSSEHEDQCSILLDEASYIRVKNLRIFAFEDMGLKVLKGKPDPVPLWRLQNMYAKQLTNSTFNGTMIGYPVERQEAMQAIDAWFNRKERRTLIVEGPSGSGKSHFTEFVANELAERGAVIAGAQGKLYGDGFVWFRLSRMQTPVVQNFLQRRFPATEPELHTSGFVFYSIMPTIIRMLAMHAEVMDTTAAEEPAAAPLKSDKTSPLRAKRCSTPVASTLSIPQPDRNRRSSVGSIRASIPHLNSDAVVEYPFATLGGRRFSIRTSPRFAAGASNSSLVDASRTSVSSDAQPDDQKSAEIRKAFAVARADEKLMPLINAVLPTPTLRETRFIKSMDIPMRTGSLRNLIVTLISALSQLHPLVLVFDDAHWLDTTSIALVQLIVANCEDVLVFIVTRPIEENSLTYIKEIMQSRGTICLRMNGLKTPDIAVMFQQVFKCTSVAEEDIVRRIAEKSGGNPLSIVVQLNNLKNTSLFALDSGKVLRFAANYGMPDLDAQLSDNLHSALQITYDRAHPLLQTVLKAAAAIGEHLEADLISTVLGRTQYSPEEVRKIVRQHNTDGILVGETAISDVDDGAFAGSRYAFRHVLFVNVIYELIPYAQRQLYHTRIAEYYEKAYGETPNTTYVPVISYHYSRTMNLVKHVYWLARLGLYYKDNWQILELIEALEEFFKILNELQGSITLWELGFDEFFLGELHYHVAKAYMASFRIEDCAKHIIPALRHFGVPQPRGTTGLIVHTLIGMIKESRRWKKARKTRPFLHETLTSDPPPNADLLVEAAFLRSEVHFHLNNYLVMTYGVFLSIRDPILESNFPKKYACVLVQMAIFKLSMGKSRLADEYASVALDYYESIPEFDDTSCIQLAAYYCYRQYKDPRGRNSCRELVMRLMKNLEDLMAKMFGRKDVLILGRVVPVELYFSSGQLNVCLEYVTNTQKVLLERKGHRLLLSYHYVELISNLMLTDRYTAVNNAAKGIANFRNRISPVGWAEEMMFGAFDIILAAFQPMLDARTASVGARDPSVVATFWEAIAKAGKAMQPNNLLVINALIHAAAASFLLVDQFPETAMSRKVVRRWQKSVSSLKKHTDKRLKSSFAHYVYLEALLHSLEPYVAGKKAQSIARLRTAYKMILEHRVNDQVTYLSLLHVLIIKNSHALGALEIPPVPPFVKNTAGLFGMLEGRQIIDFFLQGVEGTDKLLQGSKGTAGKQDGHQPAIKGTTLLTEK